MDEGMNDGKGYIHDDVKASPFLWFAIGFAIFTALSFLGVFWMYGGLSSYHEKHQAEVPTLVQKGDVFPPAPHLQNDTVADMVTMDAAQNAILESYGWVDKEKGVVRIPIDRAVKLALERANQKSESSAPTETAN